MAEITDRGFLLGASHLADLGWEAQRKNNFEITITGVGDANRHLTLAVVSGFLPNESNEVLNIDYGNSMIKAAGKYSVQAGTLVLRDFLDQDTELMVDDWRSTVYNKETQAVGLARDYKKVATVVQYAPDGSVERTWKLKGAWPSGVDYGQISQTDSGLKEISITLEYDEARIQR